MKTTFLVECKVKMWRLLVSLIAAANGRLKLGTWNVVLRCVSSTPSDCAGFSNYDAANALVKSSTPRTVQRQRRVGAAPHIENRVGYMDDWLQVSNEDSDSTTVLVFRYGNTRWVGNHTVWEFWLNGCLCICDAWVWGLDKGAVVLLAPWMYVGWQEALDGAEWLAARPGRLVPWYNHWAGDLVSTRGGLEVSEKRKFSCP